MFGSTFSKGEFGSTFRKGGLRLCLGKKIWLISIKYG